MSQIDLKKAEYYSNADIVENYDSRRFMRGGGRYVADKEVEIISTLLTYAGIQSGGVALDCPTGTGRFISILKKYGLTVLASDISEAMLAHAARFKADKYLRKSAENLGLEDGSVDVWLMSRFCFHFDDPSPFLKEASRVLKDNGFLIADFYNWTPRSWIPGKQSWLGGRTYLHSKSAVSEMAAENGFSIIEAIPVFAIAPYLYGFTPSIVPIAIESLSNFFPSGLKTKTYYLLKKVNK